MFGLIRRLSHSVIPRPDRPWEDDPTSNAPQKGRKRRLSSTGRHQEPDVEESSKKKVRGDSATPSVTDAKQVTQDGPSTQPHQLEAQDVKEVTQGVKEVELAEKAVPESIPLPEEEPDELDEPASTPSSPRPEVQSESEIIVSGSVLDNQAPQSEEPEVADDASSQDENDTPEKMLNTVVGEEENLSPAAADDVEPDQELQSKTKADAPTTD